MPDQTRIQPRKDVPLDRLVAQARAVLTFERLWPAAVTLACCFAVFATVSWLGLWLVLPWWGRGVGLFVLAVGGLACVATALRVRMPDRAAALARLDRDSGLPHRPVSTADDVLANAGTDPATQAFWDLHRRRLATVVDRMTVAAPSPRLVDRDVYATRAAVLLACLAAAFVAGPEKYGRTAAAFAGRDADAAVGLRLDAWIDPPGYTGRPPLVLLGAATSGGPVAASDSVSAPAGSAVVVRASGDGQVEVAGEGGLHPAEPKASAPTSAVASAQNLDRIFKLTGDGTLRITRDGGSPEIFKLRSIPDLPPRIVPVGTPKPNLRGSLGLTYSIEDDYGVTSAEARFTAPIVRGRPVTGRALVEPPHAPLSLPPLPGGLGEGKTTLDLSDHPWAGAIVTMTLSARDEGGNVGESGPVTLTLPAKPFSNPLARALVEQRRDLVLDPDEKDHVALALDAIQFAPQAFDVPPAVYLGLRAAQTRLAAAKTDADLLGVADLLWQMALRIENGDLSQTEQDLRAAQKALRDAMDRGAPPDEIKRLTEALRQQMDKFLSEMMKNQDRNQADNKDNQPDRNSRTVTPQDLKSMMDRMEEAARNGDMAEAQRMLDQLSSILENMKTAKRGSQQNQATREMNRSMNDLNRMMQEQGDVRDKTFQQDRGQGEQQPGQDGSDDQADQGQDQQGGGSEPGRSPQSGRQGNSGFGGLQQRQGALQQQLDDLQRKLRGLGMQGEQGLADAQEAMKQAETALGQGDGQGAVEAQGRALEGLQKGANGLAQQMAQGGQQGERAEGQGGEQDGEGMQRGEDLDPLGRPRQGRGNAQSRDLDVSGGLAARAQQVLQELRRRLGDPTRSPDEQDYLERLLKRY